jgi:hypothetical protein
MNHSLKGLHRASVGNYQKGNRSFSPYVYRREIDFHPRYSPYDRDENVDDWTLAASKILGVTNKIEFKEGLCFRNSPLFQQLLSKKSSGGDASSSSDYPHISKSDLKEEVKEMEEEKENEKQKRKKRKDPSVKEVREHLKTIMQYHEKQVQKSIPSIYPILGACGSDDEDDDGGGSKGGGGDRIFKPAAADPKKRKSQAKKKKSISGKTKKKKS